jgi:TonB family protein
MQSNAISSDWVGLVVDGRFPLLEWRGGGEGNGVFLTEWDGPGGPKAAIKLLPGSHEAVEERLARWAEAAELSHPHLTRVFHTGRDFMDGVELAYAVTEYADEVLGEIIQERPLVPGEAREMLEPVLDTLAYLHGQGFVHGHLKPSNILAVDDRLKLAGDDLHRAGDSNHGPVKEGVYAAPETLSETISPTADLWMLGATLVEVLTQRPPASDARAGRDPIVPDSMPEPFAAIARACLRRAPSERATLDAVRAMMEGRILALGGVESRTPQSQIQAPGAEAAEVEAATIGTAGGEDHRKLGTGSAMKSRGPAKTRALALVALLIAVAAAIAIFAMLSRKPQRPAPSASEGQMRERQAPSAAEQGTSQPAESSAAKDRQDGEGASPTAAPEKGGIANRVMPDVAAKASQTIHGKVQVGVRVVVGQDGRVANVDFVSPGVSRYFASRAMEAARQWRFVPPRAGGQAVGSVWTLRFVFRQSGTEASATETSP